MRFMVIALAAGVLFAEGRFLTHKQRHPLVYQGGRASGAIGFLRGQACIKKAGHWERIRY